MIWSGFSISLWTAQMIFLCGQSADAEGTRPVIEGLGEVNLAVSFVSSEGWVYDGLIEMPAEDRRRPWAVMLLGGALGTDIDWRLPAILTIDGKDTRDAATISKALLAEGFMVMRWRAIRRGDPRFAEDPLMIDTPQLAQTFDHARRALAAFRAHKVVPADHIFLLGHSLGARRAGLLLEENPKLPGVAMMAGAHLLPSDLEAAKAVVAKSGSDFKNADTNGDGGLSYEEFNQTGKKPGAAFAASAEFVDLDLDRDKRLDVHELAIHALDVQSDKWMKKKAGPRDQLGHKWAAEVIAENRTPTLMVVGTLDRRWLVEQYLMTVLQRRGKHPDFEFEIYEKIGHQLAPEVAGEITHEKYGVIAHGRAGPIDGRVVRRMVDWFKARSK